MAALWEKENTIHGILNSYIRKGSARSQKSIYVVSSTTATERGKFARTEYSVIKGDKQVSLLKINLLTGKKNQIRVHMTELGHPIVGDSKYGKEKSACAHLLLHSFSIEFTHPFCEGPLRRLPTCLVLSPKRLFRYVLDLLFSRSSGVYSTYRLKFLLFFIKEINI